MDLIEILIKGYNWHQNQVRLLKVKKIWSQQNRKSAKNYIFRKLKVSFKNNHPFYLIVNWFDTIWLEKYTGLGWRIKMNIRTVISLYSSCLWFSKLHIKILVVRAPVSDECQMINKVFNPLKQILYQVK